MVGLDEIDVVLLEVVHDFGEVAVEGAEDGYADAVVAAPHEGGSLIASLAHLVEDSVFEPACTAADYFDASVHGFAYVVGGYAGGGEFYGYVSAFEGCAVEFFGVVDVYGADYLVSSTLGYFFYHTAHFAVAY